MVKLLDSEARPPRSEPEVLRRRPRQPRREFRLPFSAGGFDEVDALKFIGNIGRNAHRFPTGIPNRLRDPFRLVGIDVIHRHPRSGGCQYARDRRANALSGTSDNRDAFC